MRRNVRKNAKHINFVEREEMEACIILECYHSIDVEWFCEFCVFFCAKKNSWRIISFCVWLFWLGCESDGDELWLIFYGNGNAFDRLNCKISAYWNQCYFCSAQFLVHYQMVDRWNVIFCAITHLMKCFDLRIIPNAKRNHKYSKVFVKMTKWSWCKNCFLIY